MAAELLRGCGYGALAGRVAVRWNGRLTTTAGLARFAQAEVSLNPRLKEFPDEVERTLRHELAHLLASERAAGGGSGRTARNGGRRAPTWASPGEPLPRSAVAPAAAGAQARVPVSGVRVRPGARPADEPAQAAAGVQRLLQRYAGGRFDARFEFVKVRE